VEDLVMRRDLHKWFLGGIAASTTGSFSFYLLIQNTQAAITGLVACYALLGLLYLDVRRRRRILRTWYHEELHSRERRCPAPRHSQTHRAASP
jgi:hypothetical protein